MQRLISGLLLTVVFSFLCFAQDSTSMQPMKETKAAKSKTMTMKGYLVDAACAKDMATKEDVMQKAASHTKECALKDMCASSGYGLFSDKKWYKFDDAGDKQAKELLDKTTKTKEISVVVKGTMTDGGMAVSSIKEATAAKPAKKMKKGKG